ncbi:MAG: prolipoprotein diacylglyceryl transferase [Bacillota bacterium]
MIAYPNIDPVALKLGPLAVRWYGAMYAAGFASSYLLVRSQLSKKRISNELIDIDKLFLFLIFGLFLGARIGYVLFYNFPYYLHNPSDILAVWNGGMSFHGGLIGVVLAGWIFAKRNNIDLFKLSDIVIVTAPIGLGLGRIGNFINGELFGRVTTAPWGMVFPQGGPLPRHPSQLYEFILEGLVLFTILWVYKSKGPKPGAVTAAFFVFYGLFRIIVEFFREPDVQLGFIAGPFTMGQILSAMMIIVGLVMYFYVRNNNEAI